MGEPIGPLADMIRAFDRATAAPAPPPAPVGPRRAKHPGAASRYRGVYPNPSSPGKRPWLGTIRVGGKAHSCGTHPTEEAAARAVDAKARELLGDAARLNFPGES